MKPFVTVFFLFFLTAASAQKIEKYYDYLWRECEPIAARFYSTVLKTDSGYVRKDYYIREKSLQMSGKYDDADCKIQNGYFLFFHANRILQQAGRYVHGKKEGLWLGFHPNKMMSDSAVYRDGKMVGIGITWYPNGRKQDSTFVRKDGSYVKATWFDNGAPAQAGRYTADGKENGKWVYFHKNGNISSLEMYDNGKLTDRKYFTENSNSLNGIIANDKPAVFPGGPDAWKRYLDKKIYFPDNYKITNADKAVVVITFDVNEEGNVENVFVSTPFHPTFDRIAENAVKKSPQWIPGTKHNRNVKTHQIQAVSFYNSKEDILKEEKK